MALYDNVGELTEDENKLLQLMDICKEVNVFQVENTMFLGYYVDAVKKYIQQNPSKKFFIWLQDNYPILTTEIN